MSLWRCRPQSAVAVVLALFAAGAAAGAEVGPPAPAARVPRGLQSPAAASGPALPDYLRDRGEGVPTSQFGTYVRRGEWVVYPFLEYYKDDDYEYSPEELGYAGDVDHRGRYRASEGLLFLAHGLGDNVVVELEAAVISASLDRSPQDAAGGPARIEESGLGDVEGQLRWRWKRESASRPELFSYFEVVAPHAQEKVLIGTPGWELKLGTGVVKGFGFGTLTARVAVEYDEASASHFDLGEYAVEYLRRISPAFRVYLGLEGTQDELSLIGELQWHFSRHGFLKLNSGFGLTSRATDWAPEVGIAFVF